MKKGSLELSVNAIVILILAITMLGLGLGFIKGMFGKISTQVESAVAAEPDAPPATAANPVSLSRDHIVARVGEVAILKTNIFCSQTNCASATTAPTAAITCTGTTPEVPTYSVGMSNGDRQTGIAKLTMGNSATTSICSLTVTGLKASPVKADFAVTIKS